ncbi:unnamed protein product [Cylindrotheca closterium]|uniref:Uncharacterized protein n=1 Tax=Cylindrotheca closterium TaxID=2856 RepID=A0AAD2CP78_9STRA|nr:unnamed protein product [Cylindrotheca closterium]
MQAGLAQKETKIVQSAFVNLFRSAVESVEEATSFELKDSELTQSSTKRTRTQAESNGSVLIVIDEASELLQRLTNDDISFFRCMRKAMVEYKSVNDKCFFVILGTFSSLTQTIPHRRLDASYKPTADDDAREPMSTYLLHHTLGLPWNSCEKLLGMSCEECHQPVNLFSMGRPLWKAYLSNEGGSTSFLLDLATKKLLLDSKITESKDLNASQILALFACRVCLTISPISMVASTLVSSHMGTAVKLSESREDLVVSYPSEPILSIAAKPYYLEGYDVKTDTTSGIGFLHKGLPTLKQYFLSGAVPKGHRGEFIVRLLNILAMDRAMVRTKTESKVSASEGSEDQHRPAVVEVKLRTFLSEFVRGTDQKQSQDLFQASAFDGVVCFTHFVYLSRSKGSDKLITPDLLRCAYRRTAAIVVDDGRKGIDWLIPVRLGSDKFTALAGQDKNRIGDSLHTFQPLSNAATHHKITPLYFLTEAEQEEFRRAEVAFDWPAVVFAIGGNEMESGLAQSGDMALRSCISNEERAPCVIFTGLGYTKLMDDDCNTLLTELRDFVIEVPEHYRQNAPLTFFGDRYCSTVSEAMAVDEAEES